MIDVFFFLVSDAGISSQKGNRVLTTGVEPMSFYVLPAYFKPSGIVFKCFRVACCCTNDRRNR